MLGVVNAFQRTKNIKFGEKNILFVRWRNKCEKVVAEHVRE